MAHVVELFGAPGTGKSSLVRALVGRHIGSGRIVGPDDLTRAPRGGPIGRLLSRDLTPSERRAALAARRDDWAELLGLIATSPIGRDVTSASGPSAAAAVRADPLRALHAPGWVAHSLQLRALADAAPDDMIVVLDEGLVQRAPVVCGDDADAAALTRYLGLLPRATLHVHLTAEPAVLLARLRDRARIIDRHAGLDDAAMGAEVGADLDRFARIAGLLEMGGAPLRRCSTDRSSSSTGPSDLGAAVIGLIAQALE